ncbi:MAG: multicopper oxidase domain-containing protein [Rhodobacteraceae bacterium]|nr:multicopper oxidase domain-containing protein [Paracoccaceae bacterium]
MSFTRRSFIKATAAGVFLPALTGRAFAAEGGAPLPIPEMMDLRGGTAGELIAQLGSSNILQGKATQTAGYSQAYLGPVIRVNRGETVRLDLGNTIAEPVSVHWHGLHIEGNQDGGPHSPVNPNETVKAALDIDQPAATLWYHSHIMERTGAHVWYGLAGMMLVEDPDAVANGLPETYGEDDLPIVVQDRVFANDGNFLYTPRGPSIMMGYKGDQILVNGAIKPEASVPAGMVRLRILNGSNARLYHFNFEDGRSFSQVATDGGLLPAPVLMNTLTLAPAERAEIIVDFSDGAAVRLLSGADNNSPMGGMMGGGMGGGGGMMGGASPASDASGSFEVMRFSVNTGLEAKVKTLPATLNGAPVPDFGEPVRRRSFRLDMMNGGMMGMLSGGGGMGINGETMKMDVINEDVPLGETEIWEITAAEMLHPFHVHGTSFQVLSNGGVPVNPAGIGLKDVVLVDKKAEILVRFDRTADKATPYMYHCHILEHEDAGMMGQFTVA